MKRKKPLWIATAFAGAWLALSSAASAETAYVTPFGNEDTVATIGTFVDGTWIAWERRSTFGQCDQIYWELVGPATGLEEDVSVHGGGGNDYLVEQWRLGWLCGWQVTPPIHNGHAVLLYGHGGANRIEATDQETFLFGGPGNDKLISYSIGANAGPYLFGNGGDDTLCGVGPGTQEWYDGGDGYDTVYDFNNSFASSANIESTVSRCNN